MRRLKVVVALAAVLGWSQVATEGQAHSSLAQNSASLDSVIEQHMEDVGIVGLGAAIIVDRKVVWTKGYGLSDRARGLPFTPDTVMNIGSISKTFTGVTLLRAAEQGKLSLDANINDYLPFQVVNPRHPEEPITLRQLATHTASITDRWSVYEGTYHYGGESPEPLGEFLQDYLTPAGKHYASENFLDVKPGSYREYSNIAAGLAGYIVELAVGEKLKVYARRHIFAPLGMDDTGWSLSDIDLAQHAKLYVVQDGITIPIQWYEGTTYPDGGVRTSVADLAKFFIALLNEGEYEGTRILDKRSVEEMLRFHYTAENKPENVNLDEKNSGIFWSTKLNVTRIGHGGSDPGVRTEMLADLSGTVGVILFTNTSLCDEGMRAYGSVFKELWTYAESLKNRDQQSSAP